VGVCKDREDCNVQHRVAAPSPPSSASSHRCLSPLKGPSLPGRGMRRRLMPPFCAGTAPPRQPLPLPRTKYVVRHFHSRFRTAPRARESGRLVYPPSFRRSARRLFTQRMQYMYTGPEDVGAREGRRCGLWLRAAWAPSASRAPCGGRLRRAGDPTLSRRGRDPPGACGKRAAVPVRGGWRFRRRKRAPPPLFWAQYERRASPLPSLRRRRLVGRGLDGERLLDPVLVCVDAHVGCDPHRLSADGAGVESVDVDQRTRRRRRKGAA